jgi:hypothetical protein
MLIFSRLLPSRRFGRRAVHAGTCLVALAASACSLAASLEDLTDGQAAGGGAAGGAAAGGGASGTAGAGAGTGGGAAAGRAGSGAGGTAGSGAAGGGTAGDGAGGGQAGAGGPPDEPERIVEGLPGRPLGLTCYDKYLFWVTPTEIWRSLRTGDEAQVVLTPEGPTNLQYVAVHDDYLYWTDWRDGSGAIGRIMRADLLGLLDGLAGVTPELVVDNQPNPTGIAFDERAAGIEPDLIYFTVYQVPNGQIRTVPIGGGEENVTTLETPALASPEGLAFFDVLHVAEFGASKLRWAPFTDAEVYTDQVRSPAGLASDGSHLYWANQQFDGNTSEIYQIDPLAPEPALLAKKAGGTFTGVAVDEGFVYWTDIADNSIYRLAKPQSPLRAP